MLLFMISGCLQYSEELWSAQLDVELESIELSPRKPALYFMAELQINPEAEKHFAYHEIAYDLQLESPDGFQGEIQLYNLDTQWDQRTLPPEGELQDSQSFRLMANKYVQFELLTHELDISAPSHTMIYVEGEGNLTGNTIFQPRVWLDHKIDHVNLHLDLTSHSY